MGIRARGDEELQVQSGLWLIVTGREKNGEIGGISTAWNVHPTRVCWWINLIFQLLIDYFRLHVRIKYTQDFDPTV